jgi:glycosyltransferase involved in cell wall biosynthesis
MVFPRSIQVSRALMALSRRGWHIAVVCADPSTAQGENVTDASLEALYSAGYESIRVPMPSAAGAASSPDPLNIGWLRPAVAAVQRLLLERRFSVFVTFAQPWVDHLVGLEIAGRMRIPWVAHFSDPWVDSLYYAQVDKEVLRAWKRMEKRIMRRADSIVFTNARAVDLVMRKYRACTRRKVHVVPHSYDPAFVPVQGAGTPPNPRLRLIYSGNVFAGRNPLAFLHALKQLDKSMALRDRLQVEFVGAGTFYRRHADELGLSDVVSFRGSETYTRSLQIAAEADVLLLMDAPSAEPSPFLPSKLMDYLMLRKPVLGLTSEGASADLLRGLGCPVVPPGSVRAIARAIAELIAAWRDGRLAVTQEYDAFARQYEMDEVARKLEGVLLHVRDQKLVRHRRVFAASKTSLRRSSRR